MESLTSEGITFKKPKGIHTFRALGKRKNASGAEAPIDLQVFRTFEPPHETISNRIDLCEKTGKQITEHLKDVQQMYNEELNENLERFMCRSFKLVEKEESVLPIGVIESGLSLAENSKIFDNIQETIQTRSSSAKEKLVVARIQSSSSCTSAKAIFQSICKQIIFNVNKKERMLDESDSDDEVEKDKGKRYYSLHDVRLVFQPNINYKIVILVEDLDYFPNSIVLQLLVLMGNAKLPIIFLLGTAHRNLIYNLIPLNSSSAFVIDNFYTVSPKDKFDAFMKLVLYDFKNPFKISGTIVSYLQSQYLEDNFSLDCVYNVIMLCVRSHFLVAKSAFCEFRKSSNYSDEMLQNFMKCTELASGLPQGLPKRQKRDEIHKNSIDSTVDELTHWCCMLRFLCFLNVKLPDRPLGDTHSQVYTACYDGYTLSNESEPNDTFHKFLDCVRRVSTSDLNVLLDSSIIFLKSNKALPKCEMVEDVIKKLENLLCELNSEMNKPVLTTPNEMKSKSVRIQKKAKNLQTLQKQLLEYKREAEGTSIVHQIRTKLIEYIRTILYKHLPPLSSIKHSEIFVFTDLNQLIAGLFPSNVLRINADLSNPGENLQCACCSYLDSLSVDKSLPDVSIIHKLILEYTTKKVDLNSVYETFKTVMQPFKNKTEDSVTGSMLLRFKRAVGELQHMGFIKRSKSRPDEICKLTW